MRHVSTCPSLNLRPTRGLTSSLVTPGCIPTLQTAFVVTLILEAEARHYPLHDVLQAGVHHSPLLLLPLPSLCPPRMAALSTAWCAAPAASPPKISGLQCLQNMLTSPTITPTFLCHVPSQHGRSVHCVVCRACSVNFSAPGSLCPMCRLPVEVSRARKWCFHKACAASFELARSYASSHTHTHTRARARAQDILDIF